MSCLWGCVQSLGLCPVFGVVSSLSGCVQSLGLCPVFGVVSSIWGCVQSLGLCPVFGVVSSLWGCVQSLGLCPVFGVVSSLWDWSLRFPRHPLFIPLPMRLPWEAFSHAAITSRRLFVHMYPPPSIARLAVAHLSGLRQLIWLSFETATIDFETETD